jgi:hypothetical protein
MIDAGDGAGQPRVVGPGSDGKLFHVPMMGRDGFRRKAADAILRRS